nr:hypothetical protein [uncultured Actinotalea sp.]
MDDQTVEDRLRRLGAADPPVAVDHARVLQVGRRRRLARRAGAGAAALAIVVAGAPAVAMLAPDVSPQPSTGGEARPARTAVPQDATEEPAPAVPRPDDGMDDAAICSGFGDVLTIVTNADAGLADGRMETQERDGWYQLATRVLDRLPSDEDSAVRAAIGELQEIAPAAPAGAVFDPTGVRSRAWNDAEAALGSACEDVGAPLAITMFTGG